MAWAATDPIFAASDVATRLKRLRRLAWMIDAVFLLPGTRFRFGLNSVIGLLPVGGDTLHRDVFKQRPARPGAARSGQADQPVVVRTHEQMGHAHHPPIQPLSSP